MTQTNDNPAEVALAPAPSVPVLPDASGALAPLTPELVASWLRGDDLTETSDSWEVDFETVVKILGASSEADALKPDDVRKSLSLVGQTFTVRSITWMRSRKAESGEGRFALMRCVDRDGLPFITSCGATKVVLQLRKAELDQWFPWQVTLAEDETMSGNRVLSLTAPDSPF